MVMRQLLNTSVSEVDLLHFTMGGVETSYSCGC